MHFRQNQYTTQQVYCHTDAGDRKLVGFIIFTGAGTVRHYYQYVHRLPQNHGFFIERMFCYIDEYLILFHYNLNVEKKFLDRFNILIEKNIAITTISVLFSCD